MILFPQIVKNVKQLHNSLQTLQIQAAGGKGREEKRREEKRREEKRREEKRREEKRREEILPLWIKVFEKCAVIV